MIKRLREIYNYRDMIVSLVKRELKARYRGSFFGLLWNFLYPICQVFIYYIVFSRVFRSGINQFHIYLISGMIPWTFFTEAINGGTSCMITYGDLSKKIYFPREVIPIATVTEKFINMFFMLFVGAGVIALSGKGFSGRCLGYIPIVLAIEYCMLLGCVCLLSSFNVFYRDVQYLAGVALMAGIWVTPVMYSIDIVGDGFLKTIVKCNPMTAVVQSFQQIFYYKTVPDGKMLFYALCWSFVMLIVGGFCFGRLEAYFAEET